jgi:uncharacterized membrane protein YhdT
MNSINFKKWAFRFTIWILILNIITFYLTINYVDFPGVKNNTGLTLFYFGILGSILLLLSIIFVIFSTIKKEKRNYQYWISIIGIAIFGILPLIGSFL